MDMTAIEEKLSVIIPVYNCAAWIRRCLDSVAGQTYRNLEILVVDDGSDDGSVQIVKEMAGSDNRIQYFYQANQGVASARNCGLVHATGSVVTFVDADDYIGQGMYERMMTVMQEQDADIVECSCRLVRPDGRMLQNIELQEETLAGARQCVRQYLLQRNVRNYVCNKIYRKRLFRDLWFPKLKYSEDYYINSITHAKAGKKVILPDIFYHYVRYEGQTTDVCRVSLSNFDGVKAGRLVARYFKKDRELRTYAAFYACEYAVRTADQYLRCYPGRFKEVRRQIGADILYCCAYMVMDADSGIDVPVRRRRYLQFLLKGESGKVQAGKGADMMYAGQGIILYGSGRRCAGILPLLQRAQIPVRAVVDSEQTKWGTLVDHINIKPPSILRECSDAALCITVSDRTAQEQIRMVLQQKYGYDLQREISYVDLELSALLRIRKAGIEQAGHTERGKGHIVFDCISGLGLGGIEEWTKGLCTELIGKGFDNLHIFTDTGEYPVPDALLAVVDQVLDRNRFRSRTEVLECIMDYLTDLLPVTVVTGKPKMFLEAADLLKQIAPDQVRLISVIHSEEEHLYRLYDKYAPRTDFFVAVSEDIKQDLVARGIPKERIASITCPVACEGNLERSYTTDRNQPVRIGYAGRIVVTQKRMDLMLKVIEALEDKGVPYVFEIAGDGPYRAEMEEKVAASGWDTHVRFVGLLTRERIPQFWRRQDIGVNIADSEGRSISQLEAMANGAVPVVTCTSGTREDICDGTNGYLVGIGDYGKIADRIAYLAAHRELLSEFGQRAHGAVAPKCRTEMHTQFWETLLRSGDESD